jgi:uncharacterized phage protein (TIGR01671 family)|nr:MAG TPA: YopX protein [Caudoviricetes sp.]
MNREIKFRGYGIAEKKWMYGYGLHEVIYGYENEETKATWLTIDTKNISMVHDESAGEYTGLKDKNGVEIYEGDIVRRPAYSEEERDYIGDIVGLYHIPEKIGEVIMYEGAWCLKFELNEKKVLNPFFEMMEFDRFDLIEVIGNIYENKNLLEEN